MKYFLVKADPAADYSIDDLERDGKTAWTGVHSFAAIGHIKNMSVGDRVFFYHSQGEKAVVGLAEVSGEPFENKDDPRPSWAVELRFVEKFKKPVGLAEFKNDASMQNFPLVRIGRLSVMPVSDTEASWILKRVR